MRVYHRPGSPNWYVEAYLDGVRLRISTEVPYSPGTRRKAEAAAAAELERRKTAIRAKSSVSFESAAFIYLDEVTGLKESTKKLYTAKLVDAIGELGSATLSEITPARIRDYIVARRRGTSDIQVRHELTAISGVLEHAIDRGLEGAPEANPVRQVRLKFLAKASSHSRAIRPEDMIKIMDAADRSSRFWKPFLTVLLETGMRHEEALGLRWDEIDLDAGVIYLAASREKTKRGRTIVLSKSALGTLLAQPRHREMPYVFWNTRTGKRYTSIWKSWGRLRDKAGCPHIRIHDIRHTFASWTRASGMDRLDRKALMGHSTEEAHELYSAVDVRALRDVVERHSPGTVLAQERKFRADTKTKRETKDQDLQ